MRPNLAAVLISMSAIVALSGCATGMKGSARRTCYDAGLHPGTPEFSNCWRAIARRDNAAALNGIVGAAAAYGIMQSAPAPTAALPAANVRYSLIRESFAYTGDRMCQYENGTTLNVGSNICAAYIGGR
jgi:hypothetical protein